MTVVVQVTVNYVNHELYKFRADANRVAKFILEISGLKAVSEETRAIAERAGIDPHALVPPESDEDDQ